jgi:hypothetical protein
VCQLFFKFQLHLGAKLFQRIIESDVERVALTCVIGDAVYLEDMVGSRIGICAALFSVNRGISGDNMIEDDRLEARSSCIGWE